MEEDLVSQSEESSQVNVLSVSVTFRQHTGEEPGRTDEKENAEEARDNSNNNKDVNNNDDYIVEFATARRESFPVNPPATPDINTEESHVGGEYSSEKEEKGITKATEVLKGWKGYSNNIYIQPIIVHHAVRNSFPYASSESRRRRLTSEDLRKQMRIRESSSWITKHNDLISSTGSLRVGESSGDARQETKTRKPRIWKGFACRKWASKFLPEYRSDNDDEYIPFTVQRYVDKSSNSSAKTGRENKESGRASESLGDQRSVDCRDSLGVKIGNDGSDRDRKNAFHPDTMPIIMNVEVNRPLEVEQECEVQSLSSTNSLFQQTPEKAEMNFICPYKADVHNTEAFHRRVASCRESRSAMTVVKNSRRTKSLGVALPVKQFPPINPLQKVKKRLPQKQENRLERPHTVDAAFVTRGLLKTVGRSDLSGLDGRAATYRAAPDAIIGQRISSCSPLYRKGERNRVKPSSTVPRETGPMEMNDADEMQLQFVEYDVERWSTNDSEISSEGNTSNKKVNNVLSVTRNNRALLGCRSPKQFHTLPQSASRNDRLNSAVSDLSDTGLGSEFDGFTKLDVFLKPWAEKGHV